MWKASAGHVVPQQNSDNDDDWETDPDFVNDVTEEEQRWGSKTIAGSGRTAGAIDMAQLRQETEQADADKKKQELEIKNPGLGYGGKFGIETDRMDKSAMGHDYIAKVEKHGSQKDYSEGFGGKFGVQKDRVDKSAAGWDHKEKVEKHSSQKDYATGFGGKFGVQNDRVDKSALGWDHVEKVEKHESQKDYSKGFGGKFGVQEDRKDKSAVGWDYVEKTKQHESQVDHKVGFGGKFGVQNDRMDKSAVSFQENFEKTGTNYTKTKPDIGSAKPSNLRAKFENIAKAKEEEDLKRTAEQKRLREEKDKFDRAQALKGLQKDGEDSEILNKPQRKSIETGRSGGIGNAINIFNKAPENESVAAIQRKEPIKLPKGTKVEQPEVQEMQEIQETRETQETSASPTAPIPTATTQQQPDVIPTQRESIQPEITEALPPPAAFSSTANDIISNVPEIIKSEPVQVEEQIYSNINYEHSQQNAQSLGADHQNDQISQEHISAQSAVAEVDKMVYAPAALVGNEEHDLAEYIEDTKIQAIALYDYQATADDEISFDPNDIITHIEQIDEGWWRGLCKNRYGLFPANYVQLQQ